MEWRSTINWWEVNPNSILLLNQKGKKKMRSLTRRAETSFPSKRTIQRWKSGDRNPTVLNFLKYLKNLNIRPKRFTNYIRGFVSYKNPKKVWGIKFPTSEHWTHVGIIAHGFFDGNECCGVLVYGTTTYEENKMFKTLVSNSNLGIQLLNYSRERVGIPASITQLLKYHYGVTTFSSMNCSFSKHIMDLAIDKCRFRKAILKAAFIDEGYISDKNGICAFGVKNDKLRLQVCKLLEIGGIEYWDSQTPSEVQVFIKSKSTKRFYNEIIKDMPNRYYKKQKAYRFLKKVERTEKRRMRREKKYAKIINLVKQNASMRLSEVYERFGIKGKDKKTFYDKYIRMLIRKNLLITSKRGDDTWVLSPESGKAITI